MTLRSDPGRPARRGGTVIPEVALLMSIFLMFLFGVLEYSRYLLALHVATNAARDGARYASVNVDKSTEFDYKDETVGTGATARTYPSIWNYTVQRMGGVDRMISGFTVSTFPCDPAKLYPTAAPFVPAVEPKAGYAAPAAAYPVGATFKLSRDVDWNEASFTEPIAVRITGRYTPILPSFLFMGGIADFNITMLCGSEG